MISKTTIKAVIKWRNAKNAKSKKIMQKWVFIGSMKKIVLMNARLMKGRVKMRTREPDKAVKFISRLCADGEKVIESEYFEGVNYLIKDDHIVILAGRHGELAVDMNKVFSLTKEINEICAFWGNIDTEKCLTAKEERKIKAV